MRVYLAAAFALKDTIRERSEELSTLGITPTSRWVYENVPSNTTLGEVSEDYLVRTAQDDIEDIRDCTILAVVTQDPTVPRLRAGAIFEAGYAYGLGKRVISIGPRENIFFYRPDVLNFPDWESAKEWLINESHKQTERQEQEAAHGTRHYGPVSHS